MALKFAANLTMFFPEHPFLERFARARAAGFDYVEFQFPYDYDLSAIARALDENNLELELFNLPPGDWSAGERGLAGLPDRVDEFKQGVTAALDAAKKLYAPRLNCLAGKRDEKFSLKEQLRVLTENLRYAAQIFAEHDIALGVEHLNPYDVPGYLLPTPSAAFAIQEQVAHRNLRVQYDIYHAQRTEGELTKTLEKNLARIGHIQLADNPGRHQPGTGEINFRFVLKFLERLGYASFVGLEYVPDGDTVAALRWMQEYGFVLQHSG